MTSLTFGSLCQIILDMSRKEKTAHGWNKQVTVVNELFQLVGISNYYEPGACSYFINRKKEIPKSRREFLIEVPMEVQVEKLAKKLADEKTPLSLASIATALRNLYLSSDFHENNYYPYDIALESPFKIDKLEILYHQKDYPSFLAIILLHVLIFVPNLEKKPEHSTQKYKIQFNQHIQHFLDNQQYYDQFHRDIIVVPYVKEKYFKVISDTTCTSHHLNPRTPEREYFYYFFSFSSQFEQDTHQLAHLEINGVDYTDKVYYELSTEYEREYPFVKRYYAKDIPLANYYHIRIEWHSQVCFPVLNNSFRLRIPCKDFKVSLEIRHYEKYKFHSSFKPFGNYVLGETNTDKTPPDSAVSYFHNRDWTYPSCGYSYLIKPQDEFWLEFLPPVHEKTSEL